GEDGTLETIESLLDAATEYLGTKDAMATAAYLEELADNVVIENTSQAFQNLYAALLQQIGPEASAAYYTIGYEAYKNEMYEQAIEGLSKAVYYDAQNRDAIFNLGNAYSRNGDVENAIAAYQQVVDLFPGTESARRSQRYINDLSE
ncbi:MAG: tetratricopeptide repeat protein, partial [Lachnospiraceae bacterium]|nr:tetratricopeptide repeat protein [Lachnospiraceae bacterium]